ncbi:hypothetical protein ElyMa_005385600 [Elysia marginata]|uniref:C-type lectin domain-containing protein n=1 Tax=Elysia marginata TaxID=1093978 RepID=A0AAV4EFN9_9GAST|nr:hypothetical protein ElyMa_005385600 [Elysia marginata]
MIHNVVGHQNVTFIKVGVRVSLVNPDYTSPREAQVSCFSEGAKDLSLEWRIKSVYENQIQAHHKIGPSYVGGCIKWKRELQLLISPHGESPNPMEFICRAKYKGKTYDSKTLRIFTQTASHGYYAISCHEYWTYTRSPKLCYGIFKTPRLTWNEARKVCKSNGAYLANITNKDQAVHLKSQVQLQQFWIGALYQTKKRKHEAKVNLNTL